MRTREKQRISKRFMAGEGVEEIHRTSYPLLFIDIEQAIRDCINEVFKKDGY